MHDKKPFNIIFIVSYYIVRFITKILHPVEISGLENLTSERVLLYSNHSSNWDPIIIVLNLPINYRLYVMGKSELFKNKILGRYLSKLGVFPVDRDGIDINTVKHSMKILKSNDNLLIFPEGTTIRNGLGRKDGKPPQAKSGAVRIAIKTEATIIPVYVDEKKKLFHKTKLIFGEKYTIENIKNKRTPEELQEIADNILEKAYNLGGKSLNKNI